MTNEGRAEAGGIVPLGEQALPQTAGEDSSRSIITIKNVAREAGVSPTTVSNLLNQHGERMTAETRTRIEAAIEKLGYRPSRTARNLRTGQAPALGLVVPSVANPFWGSWSQLLEAEAMSQNQQVLLCNTERDAGRELAYVEELIASGVRAVVLGSSLPSLAHLEPLLRRREITLVAFDRESQGEAEGVINLSVDNFSGGRMATEHLLSLGHRRIAFMSGPMITVSRRRRLAGYESAFAEYGLARPDDLIWIDEEGGDHGEINPADVGARAMGELLNLPSPPTAVVTINDMYAFGACAKLREAGIEVPKVSVMGFDDTIFASLYNPLLSTVRQPLKRMAEYAMTAIHQAAESRARDTPISILMQPTLVVRESTAPPVGDPYETAWVTS